MAMGVIADEVFGEDDDRVEQALDVECFNRTTVYNRPGFKPVRRELAHAPVTVTGSIPDDLEGVYIRNGTNPQFDRSRVRYHFQRRGDAAPGPDRQWRRHLLEHLHPHASVRDRASGRG